MVKTIEEQPPEQVRGRPPPSSGLATFEPFNLKRNSRCRPAAGAAGGRRHMTPPGTLPALPAASLSGPLRLPEVLPEGRPPIRP